MARTHKQSGFTLLEILVALAIFALAASVLLVADGRAIRQTARVQEKIQASWLADQVITQYQVEEIFPPKGKRSSVKPYQGRQWTVKEEVIETSEQFLHRIEVQVFPGTAKPSDKDVPLFRLTGYLRRHKE